LRPILIPAILLPQVINILEFLDLRIVSLFDKGILNLPAKNVGNNLHSQKGFVFNKLVLKPREVAKAIDWFSMPSVPSLIIKQL
jgi:hypothetical protein